jgi:hypothetical protein
MPSPTRRELLTFAAASALLPLGAAAQTAWPTKPVRIVVPFAAGGTTELPAAPPTSWRVPWRPNCSAPSANPSSSTTSPAQAATPGPPKWPIHRPTVTRC